MSSHTAARGTFEGKVAVVTGGSRGIGAACARGLVDRGAQVAISYSRSEDRANDVVTTIVNSGGTATVMRADQSIPQEAVDLITNVAHAFGRLDILINNAAVATL